LTDFQNAWNSAGSIGAITMDFSEEDVSVLIALKDLTGELDLILALMPLVSTPIPLSFKEFTTK